MKVKMTSGNNLHDFLLKIAGPLFVEGRVLKVRQDNLSSVVQTNSLRTVDLNYTDVGQIQELKATRHDRRRSSESSNLLRNSQSHAILIILVSNDFLSG